MKPVIGITASYENDKDRYTLTQAYIQGIQQAGGIPFIVPFLSQDNLVHLLEAVDGIVFSGGGDIDPCFFGEEPLPANGEISPERDIFEIELARLALQGKKPLLGICRGIQVINIAAGGTIYQDIHTQRAKTLKHSQEAPRWYPTHEIQIIPGTILARVLKGTQIRVNSFHHQAIAKVAPGFVVSAKAQDGIIEGIEKQGETWVLGLQCHPEWLWQRTEEFRGLFVTFVEAARKTRQN